MPLYHNMVERESLTGLEEEPTRWVVHIPILDQVPRLNGSVEIEWRR